MLSKTASEKFVILSGPDGSGKTNAIRLLALYLSEHGSVCEHLFRGSHLLSLFSPDFSVGSVLFAVQ